jgi:hypothetical protein
VSYFNSVVQGPVYQSYQPHLICFLSLTRLLREPNVLEFTINLSHDMLIRLSAVLGMCNYSIFLRNCEHVARYILFNEWRSSQIDELCRTSSVARIAITDECKRLMNRLPTRL